MKKTLFLLIALATVGSLHAFESGYVFHFNVDENMAGSEESIPSANWNLAYGPNATDAVGDANMISGVSEGGTGDPTVPLAQFRNNDRGFIFGSGAGDATTGFAPQALFLWTTNLNAVNVLQGGKASGTLQTDWATPAFPETEAMSSLTVGDLIELSIRTLPRNVAMVYRIAFQTDGVWYVDATGHTNATRSAWELYSMSVPGASVYPLPFTAGIELDVDVTDNTPVTVASLDQNATVTAYGIYVDTGDAKGSGNDTGTWCRADVFYIKSPVAPPVETIAVGGGSFSVDVDTMTGVSYQLYRDTTLTGTFPIPASLAVSGTGSTETLTDPNYGTAGSDKVFYKIKATVENIEIAF